MTLESPLLTRKEAAALCRVSMRTFERHMATALREIRIGHKIFYLKRDVRRLHALPPAPPAPPERLRDGKAQKAPVRRRSLTLVWNKKRAHLEAGTYACEVCGWSAPKIPEIPTCGLLHAHHVVPVCEGGPDTEANLILICPNHHAIAHRLPTRDKADLIKQLCELDNGERLVSSFEEAKNIVDSKQ